MKIQASISGYSGARATVYSLYRDGVLLVAKISDYREARFEDCAVVSNVLLPERDAAFGEEHLKDAIDGMHVMRSEGRLHIDNAANMADPASRVEFDSMDVNGRNYRVHPEITCAQIAVLASVWFASQSRVRNDMVEMAEKLADILSGGGTITI